MKKVAVPGSLYARQGHNGALHGRALLRAVRGWVITLVLPGARRSIGAYATQGEGEREKVALAWMGRGAWCQRMGTSLEVFDDRK